MRSRTVKFSVWAIAIIAFLATIVIAGKHSPGGFAGKLLALVAGSRAAVEKPDVREREYHLEIVPDQPDTVRFSELAFKTLDIHTIEVKTAPPPESLRLPGLLVLDPNRLIAVHSRFTGELVHIADITENGHPRQLRDGDIVAKGDVLGVVWSKEIGEKKSELVDAISKLDADRKTLTAMEKAEAGAVAMIRIFDARRNVEADTIALARAERTLRSWHLTDADIAAIYKEADDVRKRHSKADANTDNDKAWAELEIKAPISGWVVEKNNNEGAMIDPDDKLFQIADLTRLVVVANIYEEDLPALRRLDPSQWKWKIDLKSDPHDKPREGSFDLIGPLIDPDSHTGVVMGWVDNKEARLAAGQFITATIELMPDPGLVVIPSSALIEEGGASYVFVQTNAERREFARRKLVIKRRGRRTVFACNAVSAAEAGCGSESLKVGDVVIANRVLELSAELDSARSRSGEQEP